MKNLVLFIAALISFESTAVTLRNTGNKYQLGHGVEPSIEQAIDTDPCVEFDPKQVHKADVNTPDDIKAGASKEFSVTKESVTSNLQIDEYTHTSVSASVQYMAVGGSYKMDDAVKSSLSSDQLAVGIKVMADYGRWYLNAPKLKPKMAALLNGNEKMRQLFFKKCGHEFVNGYKLGQGINILLTTENRTSFYSHTHSESVGVSANYNGLGVAVSAAFEHEAKELLKYGQVNVRINGYGGSGGVTEISKTLKTDKDVTAFLDSIVDVIGKMQTQDAIITDFMTAPYSDDNGYDPILEEIKHDTYFSLYSDFRRAAADLARLRLIARNDFPSQFGELCRFKGPMTCEKYGEYIDHLVQQNESALSAINEQANACRSAVSAKDCKSLSVWSLHPELKDISQPILWPVQFRALLYQAMLDERWKR